MGKEKIMGWKKRWRTKKNFKLRPKFEADKKKKQEGMKLVGIDDGWEKRWQKNLRRQHEERELGKDNGERRW